MGGLELQDTKKFKRIRVDAIEPGMIIAHNIYSADKRYLLIRKGTILSKDIIYGLKKRGVKDIIVEERKLSPQLLKLPMPKDMIREKGVPFSYPASLEGRIFYNYGGKMILKIENPEIHDTKVKAVKTVHGILTNVMKYNNVDVDAAKNISNNLIKTIVKNKNAFLNIAGMRMIDEYTFVHSVNVAAYSAIIGREYGLEEEDLESLCLGGLLHDVGKMLVDPEILNKPDRLTNEEFSEIKTHPMIGYEILKENGLEESISIIAKMHHERCDGSGYPDGLTCDRLPISTQISAIADVYDALTSERVYKKAINSNNAMMIIISESGKHFNPHLVALFQKSVGIYPIGSFVRLNNGYIARVIEQNEGIVRPVIQVMFDDIGERLDDQVVINLMDSNELYIVESFHEQKVA